MFARARVLRALHEGAEIEILLKTTHEMYPKNLDLHFLIEVYPILTKPMREVLYLATLNRGAINQTDLVAIFAAQLPNKLAPKQITDFVNVLKKYPERHKQTREDLEKVTKLL
jgi:hypothetical protein